jgi:uncharacterized protein (TIGR00369 family)
MEVSQDARCIVCGSENPIGLKAAFIVDAEKQSAEATLTIPDDFQGWQGVVHGGIISALLDEAAIYACRSRAEFAVTAELSVKFLKPLPSGRQILVRARVVEQRRRILLVESELLLGETVHARAEVRVMEVRGGM